MTHRDRAGEPPEIAATAQRILLSDLTLPCRIGVTEEERAQRQRLRFNIQLEIRPEPPREDKITEVVDYGPLVARIRNVCAEAEFRLLESLAGRIAQACFFDARVVSARVRVEKPDRYPDAAAMVAITAVAETLPRTGGLTGRCWWWR